MTMTIREPMPADASAWRTLWAGYNRGQNVDIDASTTDELWHELLTSGGTIRALLADRDGTPVGLAHWLLHASSWSRRPSCYLEDLFVDPASRGCGVGRGLIEAVGERSRVAGADMLYWHARAGDAPARALYDQLAERTAVVVYRRALAAP